MTHEVVQGECMAAIGAAYGHYWQTLWAHSQNATLKTTRKDPNVLFPGDIVYIPDKTLRLENCSTDKLHKFLLRGVPEMLRIRLLNEFDHPLAGVDYLLQVGAQSYGGRTDDNGELKEKISPIATEAQLFIGKERRELTLSLGSLDPLTEVSGVQARLANIGFEPGPVDGELGPRTRSALQDFQDEYKLEPTGKIDDATIAALKKRHGR